MFHTCANLFQSRSVCQCEYMYVFVCEYCFASEWDCMRLIVKNGTVKNENSDDVNF